MLKKTITLFMAMAFTISAWGHSESELNAKVETITKYCSEAGFGKARPYVNFAVILAEVGVFGIGVSMIRFGWGKPSYSQEDLSVPTGLLVTSLALSTEFLMRQKSTMLAVIDKEELRSLLVDFLTDTKGVQTMKIESACRDAYKAGVKVDCSVVMADLKTKLLNGEICSSNAFDGELAAGIRKAK